MEKLLEQKNKQLSDNNMIKQQVDQLIKEKNELNKQNIDKDDEIKKIKSEMFQITKNEKELNKKLREFNEKEKNFAQKNKELNEVNKNLKDEIEDLKNEKNKLLEEINQNKGIESDKTNELINCFELNY